ncbi:uncharacterized protein LOC112564549 isoform X3 [Pomacea canaliculata]|uniref:uncharacterized protein LOC112564549 isoform X3 n=1 Tax=Pomacea canaliculata TaxID=400727 RepID=UPI000D73137F|nr:uncharacterized protein LOC112564549 isoform X3 [Pomacea canaliculata]
MAGGGALNLSLLSRGVGEVQKNGHEKVEVFLEPSDYYNFGGDRHYYHPTIQENYSLLGGGQRLSTQSIRDSYEFSLPKTFTTRKGALLLFSEDLALKAKEQEHQGRNQHYSQNVFSTSPEDDGTSIELKTVDDLAKSILHYGCRSYEDDKNKMYLKFIHRQREKWERQIRPGYSAKRYLSVWTRCWNSHVFETVVSKGYLTERSLFSYNMLLPHLRRHLFHEDLSNMPQPYRLMKNMLLSPGSMSGYTFYRSPTGKEFGPLDEEEADAEAGMHGRPETKQSIHVIRTTEDGVQREVSYSMLDKEAQREVITDLLVKSAVHYALFKQEELLEQSLHQAAQGDDASTSELYTLPDQQKASEEKQPVAAHTFDMREAVDSLLDSHRGPFTLGGGLPDIDTHSHSSEYTGSFKGGAVPHHAAKGMGGHGARASWPASADEAVKEYIGGVPVVGIRDASSASSSRTSIPHLPPIIRAPLTPIKDVSRETTQVTSLPPIKKGIFGARDKENLPALSVMPPTPQQANTSKLKLVPLKRDAGWTSLDEDDDDNKKLASKRLSQGTSEVSPYHIGSDGSHSQVKVGRRSKMKTQGSKYQPRSMASGSYIGGESVKGSTIMAPDGEIISVGGSVGPPRPHDVALISDVTQPQREVNYADDLGMSEEEPEEWPAVTKKKAKSVVSRKSDSTAAKRENDCTSGDIDATVSIHSWSYAPREADSDLVSAQEESEKSLPGIPVDGGSEASQPRSSVTEQDLLDTLTEHARRVAGSVLSQPRSGLDLEADVRQAAGMWMDLHPVRAVSRSQSVQIAARYEAIAEISETVRGGSANVSAAEYKELIRQSLTTAVAKATGLDLHDLPADAEISPELLEALTSQKLTPDDIAIVQDEESGLPVIRSRQEITRMLGVAEGHIYVSPNARGGNLPPSEAGVFKPQVSIPADRLSVEMEYDVIGYGPARSKAGSKPGSIRGSTPADLDEGSEHDNKRSSLTTQSPGAGVEEDDFQKALKNLEMKSSQEKDSIQDGEKPAKMQGSASEETNELQRDTEKTDQKVSGAKIKTTGASQKTGVSERTVLSEKTGVSQKTEVSEKSRVSAKTERSGDLKKKDKKPKAAEDKDQPFHMGVVDHKEELTKLYGGDKSADRQKTGAGGKGKEKKPKKEGEKKKGKSKKKGKQAQEKEESRSEAPQAEAPDAASAAAAAVSETKGTPPPPVKGHPEEVEDVMAPSSPEEAKSDDDMEFMIIRDEFSPEPERPSKVNIPARLDDVDVPDDEVVDADDDDPNLKSISNREARAAKRAAAAAKRKEEVERKRREREEQVKREREEQDRQEQLKREMEEERRRREEERRLRKLQEKEEEEKEEQEKLEAERRRKAAEERERRAKEEYQRKLEELRKKQAEEEAIRLELMAQKAKEEEERLRQEELMLSLMAEAERLEYERKKKEEEEARRLKEEEDRLRREEEARLAILEAKRLAEEMARRQAELEARLRFNRGLQLEANGLDHTQDINRAFVFSYFELLQWLGLDIPDFELAKMRQF